MRNGRSRKDEKSGSGESKEIGRSQLHAAGRVSREERVGEEKFEVDQGEGSREIQAAVRWVSRTRPCLPADVVFVK